MKKLLFILCLFASFAASAQTYNYSPHYYYRYKLTSDSLYAGKSFYLPIRDTLGFTPRQIGALVMRGADSTVYAYVSKTALKKWQGVGAGGIGVVTSIFGRTGDVVAVSTDYSGFYVPLARTVNGKALSTNIVIDKVDIGLANVPNVDATLRGNHVGTQTMSTISDYTTVVRNLFSAGTGLTYNAATGVFTSTPTTSVAWGALTGTITDQTDLFNTFYTKTNLQTSGQASVHYGNLTNVPVPDCTTVTPVLAVFELNCAACPKLELALNALPVLELVTDREPFEVVLLDDISALKALPAIVTSLVRVPPN